MATPTTPSALLARWLSAALPAEVAGWLDERCTALAASDLAADGARLLFTSYGLIARRVPRRDLGLDAAALAAATQARAGWDPSRWTLDQAARARLLASLPVRDGAALAAAIARLAACADLHESIALHLSLPLLPDAMRWTGLAAEGVRSSITAVFNAVALDNPYPADALDEVAWNQLALKAIFVASPLHRIVGFDRRANPRLARMLADYAHERWAAKRAISPELWRGVAPFADDAMLADRARALADPDPRQRAGAARALRACPHPGAAARLATAPEVPDVPWSELA